MASYAGRMQHLVLAAALITFGCDGKQDENGNGGQPTPPEPPLTKRQIQLAASIIPDSLLTHINDTITFEMVHKECGHTVETIDSQAIQLNMIGPGTEIPEYHDCQRMIAKDDTSYAQLIGIYATQQEQPTSPHPDSAYLLVQIMNYGPRKESDAPLSYDPLGIPYGSSCLYGELHAQKARAWVMPLGTSIDCLQRALPTAFLGLWKPLELRKEVVNGATQFDYPNVARWDWDASRKEQYIGVECGYAWCEIGRSGFASSPPPPSAPQAVSIVKGWYDVQRLAVMKNGKLVPGPVTGYIFPSARLDVTEANEFVGLGVRSAVATISGVSRVYQTKYALGPGRFTMMDVRDVSATQTDDWQANMEGPSGIMGRSVLYTKHPLESLRLRGTVRWRWSETDESVWVSCINGCCQIDPN